jgi:Reverse transcriptase (RNA-dependent DNA polymerase)
VAHLFNCSITAGHFPSKFKQTFITPILKKPGLDAEDVRPISNLSVLYKVIERLAARRLTDYIKEAGLLPTLQSSFRPLHSTETAVLKVLLDLLQTVDREDIDVLVLLDLSAAFDTVDHDILLQRLESTFGISGEVLAWLSSYLSGRELFVRLGADTYDILPLPS